MDPPLLLAGLVGAFWSLPSVCFGVLLGGTVAGAWLGAARAAWGALLGTIAGGLLAVGSIVSEFQQDRLLGTVLLGSLLTPCLLCAGLAAWLWSGKSWRFSGGGEDPGRP